jgi:tRNA-specific 2-thiouridylase
MDHDKDQSYVLFGTHRRDLARMLLPIGALHKAQVREVAQKRGLPVYDKPDSQEICFVPDNDYAGLIRRRTPGALVPGDIVDPAGQVLGRHEGHQNFTIGQRRGLGVAHSHPLYVIAKDARANTVTVAGPERLLSLGLTATGANWLTAPPVDAPRRCAVKTRYRGGLIPASVTAPSADGLEVRFDQPQPAVAPGQAVVCYDGQRVLGGGWIVAALPA